MRSSLTARKTARTALLTIGYVLMACFVLFPIVWILMMSFKQFGDIIAYPPRFLFSPTLDNYEQILFGSEAERLQHCVDGGGGGVVFDDDVPLV